MLRPGIRLTNDLMGWIYIGRAYTNEIQWQEWFTSYREFINYYADFSQKNRVDLFVIGDELGTTTPREADWRRVINEVRQRYQGPLTYSSLPSNGGSPPLGDDQRITWWDALDYIGVDAYFRLTDKLNPTVEEMKAAWTIRGYISFYQSLSKKFNKPIIFTEIGFESKDGTATHAGNYQIAGPVDLQEQADCYQASMEALWGKTWLAGIFWWQWSATSLAWPTSPQNKPAEDVLKKFYLAEEKPG
jgi:hypothetical protein